MSNCSEISLVHLLVLQNCYILTGGRLREYRVELSQIITNAL